jgi:hypothetical protein
MLQLGLSLVIFPQITLIKVMRCADIPVPCRTGLDDSQPNPTNVLT